VQLTDNPMTILVAEPDIVLHIRLVPDSYYNAKEHIIVCPNYVLSASPVYMKTKYDKDGNVLLWSSGFLESTLQV
jgi:hypothetical protein